MLAGSFRPQSSTASAPLQLRLSSFSLPGLAASAPDDAITELEALSVPVTVVAPPVSVEALLGAADGTEALLVSLQRAQLSAAVEVEDVTEREAERVPMYYRYEVQEGDNLSRIAGRFSLEREYIEWNNADLIDDPDLLRPGQVLQVPSVPGILHDVRAGETLTEIALLYDTEVLETIDFAANGLSDPNALQEGTRVLVVGGRRRPPPAPTLRPEPQQVDQPASGLGYAWPLLTTSITSPFGPSHPLGIDIDAEVNDPVFAAREGRVIFVGGDPCCSYGYYVEIDHGGGLTSLYAHLAGNVPVARDEWVVRGQVIGYVGMTGRTTGPHTHFEVREDGWPRNPLNYLPWPPP